MDVSLDHYGIVIDGKREFIWSGAIHYYRLPARELWARRLAKVKDAGFNAVDIYYAWNYHSPRQGEYDFSGIRDVDYLHKCIEDAGLYLIARPGPYICSEVDAGGFPGWLLAKKDVMLRCRDLSGPAKVVDRQYMEYVREWFEQITPRILKCKNLILFQVENEFMTLPHLQGPIGKLVTAIRQVDSTLIFKLAATDQFKFLNNKLLPALKELGEKVTGKPQRVSTPNPYIAELCEMSRELGVKVPLFHNDVMSYTDRIAEPGFAAVDDYALNMYSDNWRGKPYMFSSTDLIEKGHDKLEKDTPIFIAEFQTSWYDLWGGSGNDHIDRMFGTDQEDIATKSALAQRATLLNYFMFCAGTNWGYIGSPDVYTSYLDGSPVNEAGLLNKRYFTLKWLAEKVRDFGPDFLCTRHDASVRCRNQSVFCRARVSDSGMRYVFLRNLTLKPQRASLNMPRASVTLDPVSMSILVFNKEDQLVETVEPYSEPKEGAARLTERPGLPELEGWRYSEAAPQIEAGYDDSLWADVPAGAAMDMDSLGHHYGYIWHRGTFTGNLKAVKIDARHCFSVYVNGKLVASKDNFKNISGAGPDFAETYRIAVPPEFLVDGVNAIAIVVESLGHNKDFECDAKNPRGIIRLDTTGARVDWKWRGGLLPGEEGLCPVLPKSAFTHVKKKEDVSLPHSWAQGAEGVGLYEAEFDLAGAFNPEADAVGLVIPDAYSKVNIYLNGALVGRYWQEKGPQHKFYMPWGVLKPKGKNHLALGVWKMWDKGGLGSVRLELY